MRILLLGSGGRENALAWALARSPECSELICAPGNPGIERLGSLAPIDPNDGRAVVAFADEIDADLVVVGPEAPLVAGVADALRAQGRKVFGPDAAAAQIEASKSYAKELMDGAGIPTAEWAVFDEIEGAVAFMDHLGPPYVVKADGLAAGKGVVVTRERDVAIAALHDRLSAGRFGEAGRRVVIEEYLDGEEASLIGFCDGRTVVACQPAQDYKRVYDRDRGPNTGGMGSYSPVPACPQDIADDALDTILRPMVDATARRGRPFVGALYAGLALTSKGLRVVEFNVRFGDPETQALLPRLQTDLVELCLASATGDLEGTKLEWSPDACVSVVLASAGYPGDHRTGLEISGVDEVAAVPNVSVFHAGTADLDGRLVTSGGRVLAVSALGSTFERARSLAYDAARRITFEGRHMRTDVALKAERAEKEAS